MKFLGLGDRTLRKLYAPLWGVVASALLSGCATLASNAIGGLTEDLSGAILNSEDIELVRDGAPAFLILIDGLVEGSPDNADLLQQAAQLNSAYAAAFVDEQERARRMHDKALDLAFRAVCLEIDEGCDLATVPFKDFSAWLAARGADDVPLLYGLGATWSSWMQANSADFDAVAQLARVKALMQRVAELDESYDNGGVHLYLGVFETLFPPAMGGRPETGRGHFERAIELSNGRHLLTKVMFAENYARLVFDRPLHDKLLGEVIQASAIEPGLTLMNTVAKDRAQQLMDTADDYF